MGKEYRIHIRGKQRDEIDVDLMVQLVILMGRQLAEEAKQAQARVEAEAGQSRDRRTGAAT